MTIVDRLTVPTRASISWRYDYDAQGENLKFLKSHDPDIHPARSCTPDQLDDIIERLVRPTTASTAAIWNFDNQDANLAYLKIHDSCIELPFKTASPIASRRQCINVEDFVPSPSTRSVSSLSPSTSAGERHRRQRDRRHLVSYGNEAGGRKTMTSSTLPHLPPTGPKASRVTPRAYQYMVNCDMWGLWYVRLVIELFTCFM